MEKQQDKGFFGQPKGLSTLFFTEMWERFSYYGMRALLIYYMYDTVANGGLGLPRPTALANISNYGSLIYISSIVGGWVCAQGSRTT
ncbi:MFS transporter, partial [Enterococcus faecium]